MKRSAALALAGLTLTAVSVVPAQASILSGHVRLGAHSPAAHLLVDTGHGRVVLNRGQSAKCAGRSCRYWVGSGWSVHHDVTRTNGSWTPGPRWFGSYPGAYDEPQLRRG